MTEEKAMKEAEEWLKEMQERPAYDKRCKELAKQFRAGELYGLKPVWHLDQQDIDFSKQKDQLDEEYLVNGYSIVMVKNIKKMLDSFYSDQRSFIADKKITSASGFVDDQLCRIVQHWQKGEALIPPIIVHNDDLNLNWPADGKHRMKIAFYLGAKEIPVILPNLQRDKICALI